MSEEFSVRDWAKQGAEGLRSKIRFPEAGLLPDEFKSHMRASRKEFLTAFRSLFDKAIEYVDKPRTKPTKIKVE
jgi:hypothetical protein